MSNASQLADIAFLSGGNLEAASSITGSVWLSRRDTQVESTYVASVPEGLHIGLGVARIQTSAPDLGSFTARGPVLSLLDLTSEPADFTTVMGAGQSCSFGVHIEPEQLTAVDPSVLNLLRRLKNEPLRTTDHRGIIRRVLHLLEPIDPWFQDSVRHLVLQARGLELIAVAETWLEGVEAQTPSGASAVKAEAARDLIESRLGDPLTLDFLARSVGVNVRTLSSAFRERYGVSVAAFITDRRMQLAMQMLVGGASVSEAAYTVGYQPNAFSTAFRRQFGVSPSSCNGRQRN
ncbi:AraC-like DNA-binding protein [Rhodothalassium salexigens DSM 2132]|uniref:AraC-like DNA-binding protein n=1 Tax=Rhodothalassium salexigens DSM 2132 TaxID=1188247 RepID=A0A4R2P7U7_RHOSA|nr:helix-turn-helix domain-containing protein [Rhodothalassium salexigens]MBB4212784.1 AraC-like DNA-binding protein [Rhodothalassium salexigens DSM 2132]MBK1639773.1 hypothetical protein [Rhodothalassium salexigens DSM 2132]TCP29905.1 AraC-like DNA-binding protein [Rhodothalassium salexigens DSM 2132]